MHIAQPECSPAHVPYGTGDSDEVHQQPYIHQHLSPLRPDTPSSCDVHMKGQPGKKKYWDTIGTMIKMYITSWFDSI